MYLLTRDHLLVVQCPLTKTSVIVMCVSLGIMFPVHTFLGMRVSPHTSLGMCFLSVIQVSPTHISLGMCVSWIASYIESLQVHANFTLRVLVLNPTIAIAKLYSFAFCMAILSEQLRMNNMLPSLLIQSTECILLDSQNHRNLH